MPHIEAMSFEETQSLLQRTGFGHLGCIENNRPYIVPMHYAYDLHTLYFFTTEGTKTDAIAAHPEVCFHGLCSTPSFSRGMAKHSMYIPIFY